MPTHVRFRLPLLMLCCALTPIYSAEEKEVKLTADQVPAAVKATLTKEAAGAQLSDYEKETKDGKVVYTADIPGPKKGTVIEISVAPDGTLIGKKTEEDEGDEKDQKGQH